MKLRSFTFMIATLLSIAMQSQVWPGEFFSGYARTIKGGNFSYHSPQPDVNTSMLVRSVDSVSFIAWETAPIPADLKDPFISFVWMFGIDANPDSHKYRLYLNGSYCLTFANPVVSALKSWSVTGTERCSLTFRTTMLDKYNDPMGYAILKVPVSLVRKGERQLIKVIGESAGSNVWYMTFETGIQEKLYITQEEAVINEHGKQYFSVLYNLVHLGEAINGKIIIPGMVRRSIRIEPGYNRFQVLLPASQDSTTYMTEVKTEGNPSMLREFKVHPVRQWTIYLVQHTHTDIGYTRPQTEILPEHLRYIDYALDYCDQTDTLPDDARFRWTCETSWAVREYLRTRPSIQVDRLKKRIAEKRIEVTGLFLNSSDLADEASVAASLQPIGEFRKRGIPVISAMQSDINGVPWCLTDYLEGAGIQYLTMAQNTHRAHKPFDRPTLFWWESPSGKRILVNRPEHYMFGNSLGILTNTETFGKALFLHLKNIEEKGYPYDRYAIQFSGYLTDNSPPSTIACRLVEEWNRRYAWPKLRLATIGEFPAYIEKHHAGELPVIRGAWPDWWMDGFGSAALETAYTRAAHEDFIVNGSLMAMAKIMKKEVPDILINKYLEIADDIAFYDEHTFGAAESISDPLDENTIVQWAEKSSYAWEAVKKNRILREELLGLIQPDLPRSNVPTVSVINTLGWKRSGIAQVYVDHQVLPGGKTFTIADESGRTVPVQLVRQREEGSYWAIFAEDVPPFGYRTYRIHAGTEAIIPLKTQEFNGILENGYYRLTIDPAKGTIKSLFDKQLNSELLDESAPWQMGQFIYERLGKNRHQLEMLKLDEYFRSTLKDIIIDGITEGPVWKSITVHGQSPECADKDGISCEIRLYNGPKKIEFRFAMKKLPNPDPEAAYVAFPFRLNDGHLVFEVQGGTVIPGQGQIPGSASDWSGIQNFVAVRNDSSQVVFSSPEIPLVQLGDINLGKFSPIASPASQSIYSWVLNNYWTTNFRAYQEGELKWNYQVTSAADPSNYFATKFGWSERVPFITRVLPSTKKDSLFIPSTFIVCLQNVLMVSSKLSSDRKGIIIHIREVDGNMKSIPVKDVLSSLTDLLSSTRAKSAYEVNVLEEIIRPVGERLYLNPNETKFIKLEF